MGLKRLTSAMSASIGALNLDVVFGYAGNAPELRIFLDIIEGAEFYNVPIV